MTFFWCRCYLFGKEDTWEGKNRPQFPFALVILAGYPSGWIDSKYGRNKGCHFLICSCSSFDNGGVEDKKNQVLVQSSIHLHMAGVPFFIAKYQPPPFFFSTILPILGPPNPFSLPQKSYEQQHQFLRILSPSLEIKMINPNSLSVSILILFILHTDYFSSTTSNIIGVSKDQIQCTMCSACENPCQPLPSTPPPPPPVSTCPPPPAVVSGSPPPPSMPNSGTIYYSPPPPNSVPTYAYSPPPPPADVAGFYPPPRYGNYPAPPPPNPILPYFPYYYYNPPPSSSPNSVLLKMNPLVFFIFLLLSFFPLLLLN